MNNFGGDNISYKSLTNIFLTQELHWFFNIVKTLDLIVILKDGPIINIILKYLLWITKH